MRQLSTLETLNVQLREQREANQTRQQQMMRQAATRAVSRALNKPPQEFSENDQHLVTEHMARTMPGYVSTKPKHPERRKFIMADRPTRNEQR